MCSVALQRSGIRQQEFERFRRLIRDASGIALGDSKDALLVARVQRRMRDLSIGDYAEYLEVIEGDASGAEICRLIDAVSTNVTSFFREPAHFEVLGNHLADLRSTGAHEVRMWSAACSTGEEPYSMAMVAHSALNDTSIRTRILATDIAGDVLERARHGRYRKDRVETIPLQYRPLLRFAEAGEWEPVPAVRSMISFTRINLSAPPFPMSGPFEVIMCRNVMIYFSIETRKALIAEAERLLAPGGLLMLGHAESLAGMSTDLRSVAPAVYRKPQR